MRAPRTRYLTCALLLASVACSDADVRNARAAHDRSIADLAQRTGSAAFPSQFGFGHAATAAEIARIDIDVSPDGTGLPAGSGSPAQGATIFAAKCASCHGPAGEGTPVAAALVGRVPGDSFNFAESRDKERTKTVGNYWPYATTVFDYVRRAMPFDHPGSLTADEVYAVVAFVLERNGIVPADAVMDAKTLPQVRMPSRGKFVRDDRLGSKRAR